MTAAAPNVQRRIVDAAVELFSRKGFDGTSVQEVVDAAQVTKGAMYHYFRSKDDLLYEIYHELITEQLAGLDRIRASRRRRAAGAARGHRGSGGQHGGPVERRARSSPARRPKLASEPMAALRAHRRRYHEGVRELVAAGQRDGEFASSASAETVTLMIFGIVNQLSQWYRPEGPITPQQLADEVAGFVLTGLGVAKEWHD